MTVSLVWGFGSTLDSMVKEGLIDRKVIDGKSHYRIHKMQCQAINRDMRDTIRVLE